MCLFPFLYSYSKLLATQQRAASMEKSIQSQRDPHVIHDHEVLGNKASISHEEAMHFGVLSAEELVTEKKLRRKIDLLIMPMVVLVYLMNYIDRNNYAAARLQGLEEDLNLTPSQYQTGKRCSLIGSYSCTYLV